MVFLILEKEFDPPLGEVQHEGEAERLDPCLSAHGVRWLRSYVALDRRRMVCEFEAADAEAVRSAFRGAGVSFQRVWAAEQFFPGGGAHGDWRERRQARAPDEAAPR
jgi:hypothetical protein